MLLYKKKCDTNKFKTEYDINKPNSVLPHVLF